MARTLRPPTRAAPPPRPSWSVSELDRTAAGRVAATLGLITIAYHYSLLSLLRSLNLETPLAYLGLVPFIALGLAALRSQQPAGPDIHDRQLDYIVALPLLTAALLVNLFLPARYSSFFWVWRLDLLSLPLFVAGAIALVFGVRVLWRLRLPVGFLLLAWPLPYTLMLTRWLEDFTNLTLAGVRLALHVVPVARPLAGGDGGQFLIGTGSKAFSASVVSACAGVNGLVGFLLVAAAFLPIVKGDRRRKLAWLAVGLSIVWLFNIVRIVVIFAAGKAWGEDVAVNGFHPYLGLLTFNLGVVAMLVLLRLFRLTIALPSLRERRREPGNGRVRTRTVRRAVPRARTALTILTAVAVLLAFRNAGLRDFELLSNDLGAPVLASFTQSPGAPPGWDVHQVAEYKWAKRYFGDGSTWRRMSYTMRPGALSELHSDGAVTADVISTTDLRSFSTFGVEACYRFHNYKLVDVRSVALGGGIVGKAITFHSSRLHSDWTTVHWHWPVHSPSGTRYERVTLLMISSAKSTVDSPTPAPGALQGLGVRARDALGNSPKDRLTNDQLTRNRQFLSAFADELIRGQAPAPQK